MSKQGVRERMRSETLANKINQAGVNVLTREQFMKQPAKKMVKQLKGEEVGQEAVAQMQSLYAMMASNPKAAEYMQAEARFAIMMKDVYEILSDVVKVNI